MKIYEITLQKGQNSTEAVAATSVEAMEAAGSPPAKKRPCQRKQETAEADVEGGQEVNRVIHIFRFLIFPCEKYQSLQLDWFKKDFTSMKSDQKVNFYCLKKL